MIRFLLRLAFAYAVERFVDYRGRVEFLLDGESYYVDVYRFDSPEALARRLTAETYAIWDVWADGDTLHFLEKECCWA